MHLPFFILLLTFCANVSADTKLIDNYWYSVQKELREFKKSQLLKEQRLKEEMALDKKQRLIKSKSKCSRILSNGISTKDKIALSKKHRVNLKSLEVIEVKANATGSCYVTINSDVGVFYEYL